MKFSTRARYGLRMMVELARLQPSESLIQLHRIAKITGVSLNYLAQLAISLKDDGLLIGVSGKKGGYQLSRPPEDIRLREIIKAVQGPIFATDCVVNPDICMNAEFCEARLVWGLLTHRMLEILNEYTLADLIDRGWAGRVMAEYPDFPYGNIKELSTASEGSVSERASSLGCQKTDPKTSRRS